MAIKRNAGKDIGPKPLLLDRARRARPAPVRRVAWHRRALKPSLALALILGVGGIALFRGVSAVDTTRIIQAAPLWLQNVLPTPASTPPTPSTALQPASSPTPVTLPPRPELHIPDFTRSTPTTPTPPAPITLTPTTPTNTTPQLPTDTWSVLTNPPPTTTPPAPTTQP